MRTIPNINIKEEKRNYKIELAVPGFRKEDFNIYTEGKELIISCQKELKRRSQHTLNTSSNKVKTVSHFLHFLTLPDDVDCDHVTAKYNGVLKLNIPKKNQKTIN